MEAVYYEGQVLWSMVDANMHLRHSAYADLGAQARLNMLQSVGFDASLLEELHTGPILFREELIYLREVRPNETLRVTVHLSKCRPDGSRWSFRHEIFRADGVKAAIIHIDGAWIDTEKRKLTKLPEKWESAFLGLPRTEDFVMEVVE